MFTMHVRVAVALWMMLQDSDDKCVCCGHVMYKSAGVSSATTSSVFGDRAFKVSAPPTTGKQQFLPLEPIVKQGVKCCYSF